MTADFSIGFKADEGIARIWDIETGQARFTMEESGREAWCCAFSPDGSRLASGGMGACVTLWESETGNELARLYGSGGPVRSCAFSPDGSRIVAIGEQLALFDADDGREIFALEEGTSACAFSPDGTQIVSGLEDLEVRDARSGQTLRTLAASGPFSAGRVSACAYSPDGSLLASSNRYHAGLHIWNPATGELRATIDHGRGALLDCCWSPDGRFVVAGLIDGTVRITHVETGETHRTLEGHAGTVIGCAVSSSGALVVTASADGTLRVWNGDAAFAPVSDTERAVPPRFHIDTVLSCDVSADGSFVVSTSRRGTIAISEEESGAERVTMEENYTGGVEDCAVSPDDSLVITAHYDGTMVLWDTGTGEQLAGVGCVRGGIGGGVRGCAVSPDGAMVVSANGDGTLKIWDADALWREHSWRERGELAGRHAASDQVTSSFESCCVSPDGAFIVSGSADSTLVAWVAEGRRELASLEGHAGPVRSCAFSPDQLLLASASSDTTVKLWDLETWSEQATIEGHADSVTCCAFSPDGLLLLSASQDGVLRLWDRSTLRGRATIAFPGGLNAAAFNPARPRVECGGRGGDLYSVELVGIDYGPIVVTAADSGEGLAGRCPTCLEHVPLDLGGLGQEMDCPRAGCDGRMRVNPFVARRG